MSERYNGWRKYETWSWNLIVNNDESLQSYVEEIVENYCGDEVMVWLESRGQNPPHTGLREWIKREIDTDSLENKLRDWTQECFEGEDFVSPLGLLMSQLLQASIQEIDFREIAISLLADWLESQG